MTEKIDSHLEAEDPAWSFYAIPSAEDSKRRRSHLARLLIFAMLVASLLPAAPVFGDHANRTLDVAPETASNPVGSTHTVTATLSATPDPGFPVNIDFEVESGPPITTTNNPGSPGTPVVVDDGSTLLTPDMTCTVTNPGTTCTVSFSSTQLGTNQIRAWIDHDNNNATVQAGTTPDVDLTEGRNSGSAADCPEPSPVDPCEQSPPVGTAQPGTFSEPDITDVVSKTWIVGAATRLDCNDASGDEAELNPTTDPGSAETYTCTARDNFNNPVTGVRVDAENMAGANDPDNSATPSATAPINTTADYNDFCTTGSSGACSGQIPASEGQAGNAEICFWSDLDSDTQYDNGSEADGSRCPVTETVGDPENDNNTDKVLKTWQHRGAGTKGVDAQPETDVNATGETHTVTAQVYDEFGQPFIGATTVNFEFFAGSPADPDASTSPGTPDRTCITSNSATCAVSYTSTGTGTDLICVWINDTPSTTSNTCGGEGREDPTVDNGPPSPSDDDQDVVEKTWRAAGAASTITLEPGSDSNIVGETHTVTATVTDFQGNPSTGTAVTFTASGTGSETPPSGARTTNSEGKATFSFTSNNTGTSRITATAGPATATATKTWTYRVTLTPTSDANNIGETHTVTATVTRGNGAPVTATVVTFTATGTGRESPNSATSTTDGQGRATFSFTSDAPGTSNITATAGGGSGTATKQWRVPLSPPRPGRVQYLPEGSTSGGFTTFLLIANPQSFTVSVTVTFLTNNGPQSPSSVRNIGIPPGSRHTIDVGVVVGPNLDVGAKVEGSADFVAEMSMHKAGTRANADTIASPVTSNQWIMPEGATHSGFQTFVQVINPNEVSGTVVAIRFLLGSGSEIDGGTLAVPAGSRRTIHVNVECACSADVSTHLSVQGSGPLVVASMSLHKLSSGDLAIGGSLGLTSAGDTFVVAEGATHSEWTTFILVANPEDVPATINVTFLTKSNGTKSPAGLQGKTIPARSRLTINVNAEIAPVEDDVSTIVDATAGQIAVESTIQKADASGFVIADSIGSPGADVVSASGTKWLAAEGTSNVHEGSRFTTFILVANPTATDATVSVTFLTKGQGTLTGPVFVVPALSRRTIDLNVACGCLDDDVSTVVEAVDGRIVVEMSLDWAKEGVGFSKGRSLSARLTG